MLCLFANLHNQPSMKTDQQNALSKMEHRNDVITLSGSTATMPIRVQHPHLRCQWQVMWNENQQTLWLGDLRHLDAHYPREEAYDLFHSPYLLINGDKESGSTLFEMIVNDRARTLEVNLVRTSRQEDSYTIKYFD